MSVSTPARSVVAVAIVAAVVSLASSSTASAQSGWELILDVPSARFSGVDFPTPDEGWLVAGGGLLQSTDGGRTWTEAAQVPGNIVEFYDRQHGWVIGGGGTVHATTDGGLTWHQQATNTNVHLKDIVAIGPEEAWVVGSGDETSDVIVLPRAGALLHTTDGGATWRQVDLPPASWFDQLEFVGDHGWALGEICAARDEEADPTSCPTLPESALLHTTDAGATWAVLDADIPENVWDFEFVDETRGWLTAQTHCRRGGCQRAVYTTQDAGLTWQLTLNQPRIPAEFIEAQDSLTAWVAGTLRDGDDTTIEIWQTVNGGASWSRSGSLSATFSGFLGRFWRQHDSFFITGGALAARSNDGRDWAKVETPVMAEFSLDFVSPETGFALSGDDLIRSEDGGITWQRVGTPPGIVRALEFIDDATGFVWSSSCDPECASSLQRTTDGGQTWRSVLELDVPGRRALRLRFIDPSHGWLLTDDQVFLTGDGGANWQRRTLPAAANVFSGDLAARDRAWLIARAGNPSQTWLYGTTDGARTWSRIPVADAEPIAVDFLGADDGWSTAYECAETCGVALYASHNSGETWEKLGDALQLNYPGEFVFVDELHGWANTFDCAIACTGQISRTADGGRTWTVDLEEPRLFGRLIFVDGQAGWFLVDPARRIGLGGGPPSRTLLYRMTADAGPTERPVQFPDVGGAPERGSTLLYAGLLAALGASLVVGGAGLRRARH